MRMRTLILFCFPKFIFKLLNCWSSPLSPFLPAFFFLLNSVHQTNNLKSRNGWDLFIPLWDIFNTLSCWRYKLFSVIVKHCFSFHPLKTKFTNFFTIRRTHTGNRCCESQWIKIWSSGLRFGTLKFSPFVFHLFHANKKKKKARRLL